MRVLARSSSPTACGSAASVPTYPKVARGRLREQGFGEPAGLGDGQAGPGAGPAAWRGADVEADPLGRVTASAEGEMAYLDLPAARGPEADVKTGAAGAGDAVHGMPPRAAVIR